MSVFSNIAITNNGHLLLSHIHAGAVLIPTKIVLGSGTLSSGATTNTMESVISPVVNLAINKVNRSNDGNVVFGGAYNNSEVTEAFYYRELALYCRGEYRDSNGVVTQSLDEVMFVYGNSGSTADYMPAYASGQPVERQIDLVVYVGNDAVVNVTIDPGIAVSREEFETARLEMATRFLALQQKIDKKSDIGHNHDDENIYPASVEITPPAGEGHGGYIDFHYDGSATDYTTRLIESREGVLQINENEVLTGANIRVIGHLLVNFQDGLGGLFHAVGLNITEYTTAFVTQVIYTQDPVLICAKCVTDGVELRAYNNGGSSLFTGEIVVNILFFN